MKRIGFLSFGHWTDSPGSQVRSARDSLLQSMKKLTDAHHAPQRQALRARLFDHHDGRSAQRLVAWLERNTT